MIDPMHIPHRLRSAMDIITRQARLNAAAFSRRIPAATKTRGALMPADRYVECFTDGNSAPNAAPFEYAEKHPLFGSPHGNDATQDRYGNPRDWYRQPHRPYMSDAVSEKADEAVDEFANVVDDWCRDLGFRID